MNSFSNLSDDSMSNFTDDDDDVLKLFMQCNETNFLEDPELFHLLNDYFTTIKGVSELCEFLRNSLLNAEHDECFLIDEALRDFEAEKLGYGEILEASFRKTLADLKNLNDFDSDVFSVDVLKRTQICYKDLATLVFRLEKMMKDIEKKLKHVRRRRAIVTAAIVAPVIVAISVSKIAGVIFGSVPIGPLSTIVSSKWRKSTKALKLKKIAMTSMERGVMVALKEIEKIGRIVSNLESVESSIHHTAKIAVKKRSSVAVAMGGMEREEKRLKSTIVDLEKETKRCDDFAKFGCTIAQEKIVDFLSGGVEISSR